MAVLAIVLLAAGVAGAVGRPWHLPAWATPLSAAAVALASGAVSLAAARRGAEPLAAPVGFLLAAVPLAVMLDRIGFFSALAARVSTGRRALGGLWVLAALVTTVLNLDASVVLLTPLYVNVARKTGRDPLTLAFMPVMLACLASSALPVSNLTNLIAAAETGASTTAFLAHLGLPSLVATAVGWLCYRRFGLARSGATGARGGGSLPVGLPRPSSGCVAEREALVVGGTIVVAVLVGFVAGRSVGAQPWMVALGADLVMLAVLRRVPWREVPVGTALVAGSLAVLAAGAAAHLPVRRLLVAHGLAGVATVSGVTAATANVVNNLPALLVALPSLGHRPSSALWAVLVGVNMGPVLLVTGSLASLLWLDALGRLGVAARAGDFSWIGLRVGLPAAASGLGAHLALHAVGFAR